MKCLVFAPGIMGSVLRNDNGYVWPPKPLEVIFGYNRVDSLLDSELIPTEPIYKVGPKGVYKALLDDISRCGYSKDNHSKRLISFAYDWRKSNTDSAEKLAHLLDVSFPSVPHGLSITLLAHSMGGLVMRYLLESGHYSTRRWFSSITRLITMGTPQFGASLALSQLRGKDGMLGLSGSDIKRIANDPSFPSTYELIPPEQSALTIQRPFKPGDLPAVMDPFDNQIANRLSMTKVSVNNAREFWSCLNLKNRPKNVEYFFVVGSSMKTNIRNEWINVSEDPDPVYQKASGDGTVPIVSSCVAGIPHIFSQKNHNEIFKDRNIREYLYQYLDASDNVHPQSAAGGFDVGDKEALGISVNQDVYDQGEEIEVIVSFNQYMTNPNENFELAPIDLKTGEKDTNRESKSINIQLRGVSVSVFSFSITDDLEPGLYEILSSRDIDDPEPTTFYIRNA